MCRGELSGLNEFLDGTWCGVVWCDVAWFIWFHICCGVVWYGVVWGMYVVLSRPAQRDEIRRVETE